MREIKFRCWWENRMYTVEDMDFKRKIVNLLGADIIKASDCVLMQYTGLKDENDTKIYEGDILTDGTDFAIVEWSEDRASFILKPIGEYYFDTNILGEALDESFAVVGNIYENKKLLEAE